MSKHTIVLVQYTASFNTRSYMDFQSVSAALDALVKMYEHKLKELNPNIQDQITYDINDLYRFLDSLYDVVGLVLDPTTGKYDPRDKEWLKKNIFHHLRNQAQH